MAKAAFPQKTRHRHPAYDSIGLPAADETIKPARVERHDAERPAGEGRGETPRIRIATPRRPPDQSA